MRRLSKTDVLVFDSRYAFEDWLYMHTYNMIADDFHFIGAPSVFDPELIRAISKNAARETTHSFGYKMFALEGIDFSEQVRIIDEAYNIATVKYSEETGKDYNFSHQH